MIRFRTDLMPHQMPAADKLTPLRAGALLMDMGTGKTRTALEIAARRMNRTKNPCRRVLWFCPVTLKETLERDILKHVCSPRVYVFDDRTRQGRIPEADFYIIGIESMSASDRVILAAASLADERTLCVVDESTYIKNHRASRTRWITQIGERCGWRLVLTGTPLTQGVVDLFAQFKFLSPQILGYTSFYSFAANHLEYEKDDRSRRRRRKARIVRAHNVPYLAAKIAPYSYQVTKDECLDLPQKLYEERWCRMTAEQEALYERVKDEICARDDLDEDALIYLLFTGLQQVACGFWNRPLPASAPPKSVETSVETIEAPHYRLALLRATLEEIPEEEPVVIWAKYRRCVRELAEALEPLGGAATYYGDLSPRERDANLARFAAGDCRFFVATPTTGGHGLNELVRAAHVLFYTNSFKYSERVQAEDRCHRIGQTRRPVYIDIGVSGGIDERIQQCLHRKGNVLHDFKARVREVRSAKTRRQAMRAVAEEL